MFSKFQTGEDEMCAGYFRVVFQIHSPLFSILLCSHAADLKDLQQYTCSVVSHWGYPEESMDR